MVCNSIQISPLAVEDAQVHKGQKRVTEWEFYIYCL